MIAGPRAGARRAAGAALAGAVMLAGAALAGDIPGPGEPGYGVRFNQHVLEEIARAPRVDVGDLTATFAHVFTALPDVARIYPTENYYYFTFHSDGVEYAGNLRLDAADRDDGVLHFAYYPSNVPWAKPGETVYRALSRADGVEVRREGELRYRVTFEGRSVRFLLNDLADVAPPPEAVREGERYLGPVFDEAGIGFHLLFSGPLNEFLFVLDDRQAPGDRFERFHEDHPALEVGRRTGFAVYADRYAPRRILVGVHLQDVELNTWLDGPFDQLPDNFIDGTALQDAILSKHPDLEGEIDRFGGFRAGDGRYLVNPYINYAHPGELERFLRCADPALDERQFYACIVPPDEAR